MLFNPLVTVSKMNFLVITTLKMLVFIILFQSVEEASIQRIPQLIQPQLPQLQGNFAALSQGKFDAADTEPKTSLPEAVPVPTEKQIKSEPVREAPLPSSVDHVESMLENMFQQDETVPAQQPSTLNDERRFPALTDDKVVEILQDKEEEFVKTEIKEEIKTEVGYKNVVLFIANQSFLNCRHFSLLFKTVLLIAFCC